MKCSLLLKSRTNWGYLFMGNQIGVISTGLFGWNKKMVNEHIQTLIRQHSTKIAKMNEYIENQLDEKDKLAEELAYLQEHEKSYVMSEDLKAVVSKRALEVPAILRKATDIEINETIERAKQNQYLMDIKISAIQKETHNTKEYIDLLMKDISKIFNKQKVTGKDIESARKDAIETDKAFTFENTSREEPEIKSGVKASDSPQLSTVEGLEENNVTHQPLNRGFWEEDDETCTTDFRVVNEKIQEKTHETDSLTYKVDTSSEIEDKAHQSNDGQKVVAEEQKGSGSLMHNQIESKVKSEALATEIRFIRSKYLIGKIAGEDLYDNDGNLIIAKSEVITHEVVEKADSEGKLAELIIKMTLPGLGD